MFSDKTSADAMTSDRNYSFSSNNLMDFADFLDSDDDKMENNEAEANTVKSNDASKVVFSGKQPLFQMPRGWVRKIVASGSGVALQRNVCYLNPAGQRFSNLDEVQRYFGRLGQAVMPGVFNFDPPQLVDEDDDDGDDDDDGEDDDENCSSTTLQHHQQQQQQQFATSLS